MQLFDDEAIYQFKGYAYKKIRLWWFPLIKKWQKIGPATGNEPHLFPAPIWQHQHENHPDGE